MARSSHTVQQVKIPIATRTCFSLGQRRPRERRRTWFNLMGGAGVLTAGLRWWKRSPTGVLGAALLLSLVVSAVAAPLLTPYDPLSIDVRNGLVLPSLEHPLGTDHLGRDVLSRLLFGARASLGAAGAVAVLITVAAPWPLPPSGARHHRIHR